MIVTNRRGFVESKSLKYSNKMWILGGVLLNTLCISYGHILGQGPVWFSPSYFFRRVSPVNIVIPPSIVKDPLT